MTSIDDILAKHLSKQGSPSFFFDVDGTLKECNQKKYSERFNPALPALLHNLQQLGAVGINTDQSGAELQNFQNKLDTHLPNNKHSVTGPYILEGGHVLVPKDGSLLNDFQIVIDQASLNEINAIYQLLVTTLILEGEWIFVNNLPKALLLPPKTEQGIAAKVVFEKGPSIDDPTYMGEYAEIESWVADKAVNAGLLSHASLLEAGNGTLRIIKKGVNKGTGFDYLESTGVDLSRVIYSGDQINELPAVKVIKEHGGTIVLPNNHHPHLRPYADYISNHSASDGVVEIFSNLL